MERPGAGDDTRAWGPPYAADGAGDVLPRREPQQALGLRSTWRRRTVARAARELARRADVLVENFKPGTLERLGWATPSSPRTTPRRLLLDHRLRRRRGRDLPGYDLLAQAIGGLMSVTGPAPGSRPRSASRWSTSSPDSTRCTASSPRCGTATAPARVSGSRSTCCRSLLSALVNQASGYVAAGVVPGILGNATRRSRPTRSTRRPTGRSCSRSATTASSRAVRVLGLSAAADDAGSPRTRRASPTATAAGAARDRRSPPVRPCDWHASSPRAGVPCGADERPRGGVRPRHDARARPGRRGSGLPRPAGRQPGAAVRHPTGPTAAPRCRAASMTAAPG